MKTTSNQTTNTVIELPESVAVDDSDINLKELLKSQIQENLKFREMLTKFIDHKNKNVFIGKYSLMI